MTNPTALTLVNPQNGNLAFKLFSFEDNSYFDYLQRNNYYSLIWVTSGSGKAKADFSEYDFVHDSLFAFSPYQPFMLSATENIRGYAIQFHPDFFVFTCTKKKWRVMVFYSTTFIILRLPC